MDDQLLERLVLSFESIAESLKAIHEETKQAGARYWRSPKQQKEAIVSRVEPEDERAKRMQGARRRTIEEIVDPNAEEDEEEYNEIIGERTRQWYRDHPQEAKKVTSSPKDNDGREEVGSSSGEAESQSERTREVSPDHSNSKKLRQGWIKRRS